MAIYLCRICGHTMGRSLGRCIMCRGKSIDCFGDPNSPEFLKLKRQLTGHRDPWTERKSAVLVFTLVSIALAGGFFIMEGTKALTASKSQPAAGIATSPAPQAIAAKQKPVQ